MRLLMFTLAKVYLDIGRWSRWALGRKSRGRSDRHLRVGEGREGIIRGRRGRARDACAIGIGTPCSFRRVVFVPVVSGFQSKSALLQARSIEIKRFVVYLRVHLVHVFFRFRATCQWAGSRDGVAASFFIDSLIVGDPCLAIVFQPLPFELFLCHVFVRLDRRTKT